MRKLAVQIACERKSQARCEARAHDTSAIGRQPVQWRVDRHFPEPVNYLDLHHTAGCAPPERAIKLGNGMSNIEMPLTVLCGSVSFDRHPPTRADACAATKVLNRSLRDWRRLTALLGERRAINANASSTFNSVQIPAASASPVESVIIGLDCLTSSVLMTDS
jgi:hypothetical protein